MIRDSLESHHFEKFGMNSIIIIIEGLISNRKDYFL